MKRIDNPDTSAKAADAETEFDFSRALVPREVPYADVQHLQGRTWRRLNQRLNREEGALRTTVRWQSSFVVAACTLTFVFGVWVGRREQPLALVQPQVSAEPVAFGQQVEIGAVDEVEIARVRGVGNGANDAVSLLAGSSESSSVGDELKLGANNGRGREQNHVAAAVVKAQSSDVLPNVALEPAASAADSVVLSTPTVGKSSSGRPVWQNLANKGEYEAALVEIAQAGGYERVLATANPEQLMLLSDVARATGQQQRALAALGRIVNEHSNDPVAPLAALNMGNLLDKMGDGSGATLAFARYRALSPKGEFAEDALVRQLRSAVKAGQQALAQKLVRQYEADFPDGRSAGEVAQLAEQLPETAAQSDAGVSQ